MNSEQTEINNKDLYESDEVVAKYGANSVRVRSLNIPEKIFVDRFNIKDKKVLVLGSGAGRVPANFLLFGNKVVGVDRSKKLTEIANKNFSSERFPDLSLIEGDITDLSFVPDEDFDVVFFPMNTIDYLENYDLRKKALLEASKKLKKGGIFAFSSHNKLGYIFSPKIDIKDRNFGAFRTDFFYATESVVGGGVIFKGNPDFIINDTIAVTNLSFVDFICDERSRLDKIFSANLSFAKWWFPYILYVFRK